MDNIANVAFAVGMTILLGLVAVVIFIIFRPMEPEEIKQTYDPIRESGGWTKEPVSMLRADASVVWPAWYNALDEAEAIVADCLDRQEERGEM